MKRHSKGHDPSIHSYHSKHSTVPVKPPPIFPDKNFGPHLRPIADKRIFTEKRCQGCLDKSWCKGYKNGTYRCLTDKD